MYHVYLESSVLLYSPLLPLLFTYELKFIFVFSFSVSYQMDTSNTGSAALWAWSKWHSENKVCQYVPSWSCHLLLQMRSSTAFLVYSRLFLIHDFSSDFFFLLCMPAAMPRYRLPLFLRITAPLLIGTPYIISLYNS